MPRVRRKSRRLKCQGKCGKKNCEFVADRPSTLLRHASKKKVECPVCLKTLSRYDGLLRHGRACHPERVDLFPAPKTKLKMPDELSDVLGAEEFCFIKSMVSTNIACDKKSKKMTPEHRAVVDSITKDNRNAVVHELARQLATRAVGMLQPGAVDDFGGRLPDGFVLQNHGGLFKLSLDRLDNNAIHYPNLENAFDNIRLVGLGVNVRDEGYKFTLQDVQQHQKATVDLPRLLEYETRACVNKKNTTLYMCAHCIFRTDAKCRECFGTWQAMWEWARQRLKGVKGLCEVSHSPMCSNDCPTRLRWTQMSIDAIDPRKGHVRGNMRLVCLFLNPANRDNDKKYDNPGDPPTNWTTKLYREYFQIT